MPNAKKIQDALLAAGCDELKSSRQGRGTRALSGFRIQTSDLERRALHVFHVGRGNLTALSKYKRVLMAAGYLVSPSRGGLKVMNAVKSSVNRASERRLVR